MCVYMCCVYVLCTHVGTNPNNSTRKRLAAVSGDDFHFSSDGKLMINEEPMEEESEFPFIVLLHKYFMCMDKSVIFVEKGHDNSSSRKRVRQDDDKELEEEFQSYVCKLDHFNTCAQYTR